MIYPAISMTAVERFYKILYLLSFLFLSGIGARAQTDQRDQVVKKLQDISTAYRKADHLSFDTKYRYASEKAPTMYLDSLSGSFKLNGDSYWYLLDNTEFMGSDTINLAVFKEDKIIYLNSPSLVNQSANPLAMIDSVILNNAYSKVSLTDESAVQRISIDFVAGLQFKSIEYLIDAKSGFITKMTAIIKSDQMYDPAVQPMFDKTAAYGILEMNFTNYQTGTFTDQVFNPGQYFTKSGTNYLPTATYNGYQVVTGARKP